MCNVSWDWTFPEVESSYQIWQPSQKRQFARTGKQEYTMNLASVRRELHLTQKVPRRFLKPAVCKYPTTVNNSKIYIL